MGGLAGSWIVHRTPCAEELHRTGRRLLESIAGRGSNHQHQPVSTAGLCMVSAGPNDGVRRTGISPNGRYIASVSGGPSSAGTAISGDWFDGLLASVMRLGIDEAMLWHQGAFCAAIWDNETRSLTLCRDRMGEGDLYYAITDYGMVYASDLRGLMTECPADWGVDQGSLSKLLRYGYISAPNTIFQGVYKLERGTLCTISAADVRCSTGQPIPSVSYWDHRGAIERALRSRQLCTIEQSVDGVEQALAESLRQMPEKGSICLLSGGVDSSLVASAMQRGRAAPIDTLTVGFEGSTHDESAHAARVAKHIGASNECVMIGGEDALTLVSSLPRIFSEPFADSAAIPTLAAARYCQGHWSTVLTGDGGDELFFGHSAYPKALRNYRWASKLPAIARRLADRLHQRDPEQARLGGMSALFAEARCSSLAETYLSRVSRWRAPSAVINAGFEHPSVLHMPQARPRGLAEAETLLFLDQAMELSECLLTKSDRTFGSVGMQVHNPFLSEQMVELSWEMGMEHKFAGGVTKSVLRGALQRHLPASLVHRPKMGFGAPISCWLRGPLRDWAEALLSKERIERRGVLDADRILALWGRFLAGERKLHTHLWPVLMYLAWEEQWNTQAKSR